MSESRVIRTSDVVSIITENGVMPTGALKGNGVLINGDPLEPADVGLGNVNNTSDANKPISTAQQAALDAKLSLSGGVMTGPLRLSADPTIAMHAATKQYVDTAQSSGITASAAHATTEKTAIVDADEFIGLNSASSFSVVKYTWGGIKALLNTLYKWETVAHAATSKTTPVDADELSIVDSAASNVIKKLTWANLKATLNSIYDWATVAHAATSKTTPVDADELSIVDSAASNVIKKLTWANLKATLKTYFDGYYSPITRSVNAQTGTSYTFVIGDAGKLCTFSNASAITVTVPPNSSVAFAVGTQIDVSQLGAGKVTLAQGSGVTISSVSSNKSLSAQYAGATLFKTATDTWVLVGSLIA